MLKSGHDAGQGHQGHVHNMCDAVTHVDHLLLVVPLANQLPQAHTLGALTFDLQLTGHHRWQAPGPSCHFKQQLTWLRPDLADCRCAAESCARGGYE